MTRDEQREVVLRLACLTEDRTNAEQRAMLEQARIVDDALNRARWRNAQLGRPNRKEPSALELLVLDTRVLDDGDKVILLKPRSRRPWVDDSPLTSPK